MRKSSVRREVEARKRGKERRREVRKEEGRLGEKKGVIRDVGREKGKRNIDLLTDSLVLTEWNR